jgi:hypothetical protein
MPHPILGHEQKRIAEGGIVTVDLARSITGRVGVIPTRWTIIWGGHRRPNGGSAKPHPYPDARAHVGSATINAAAINTASTDTASTDTAHGDSTGTDTASANSGGSIR